jgi:hypothetical protein
MFFALCCLHFATYSSVKQLKPETHTREKDHYSIGKSWLGHEAIFYSLIAQCLINYMRSSCLHAGSLLKDMHTRGRTTLYPLSWHVISGNKSRNPWMVAFHHDELINVWFLVLIALIRSRSVLHSIGTTACSSSSKIQAAMEWCCNWWWGYPYIKTEL